MMKKGVIDMQKILQVNKLYYPWIGGVETIVQQIAEGLRGKAQMEVLACQPKGKGGVEEINGVKIYKAASFGMMMGMPISLEFFRLFKKLVKENDLIFLHHPYPMGFLAYYLFGRSKKMIVWYHSDIVKQKFFGFLFSPILKTVLKKAQKIFVSNPNLIESSKMLKKFQKKCVVVPFGIKPEFFQESDGVLKQAQEIRKKFGEPLVLAVGRLTNYKGFEYLIEASNSVNAKFLLIGDGALKNKLLRLIRRFRLGSKFFIIPPASDLLLYYHACDVFVLPSIKKSEAFGIVLLEAMACGKPVVSTQLGTGTSFVNQDKKTGFVVEPKNSSSLAKVLKDLIANSTLRSAFGQRARERASEFTLEKFLEKVWRELVI